MTFATSPARDGQACEVERATRIMLRPIANPLPLGFLALAGGTLLLSALQLGWISPTEAPDVALILLAFVAPLQLVASVFGFLARDVVAGTGMGILAGTWLAVGLVMLQSPVATTNGALGLLLLLAAVAMLVPASVATSGKVVAALVLFTTAVRFAVTGVYHLTSSTGWKEAAGVVGLVLCALAVYTAFAMAIEDALHHTVLPLLRRGAGRESLTGNFVDQLEKIERQAGVREQF